MKVSRQQFDDGNRAAAEVILSNPAKYGGDGALLVQWARRILEQPAGAHGGTMRQSELYKLQCHRCGKTVELPAGAPQTTERLRCPRCGAALQIDWRGAGATAATAQGGRQ